MYEVLENAKSGDAAAMDRIMELATQAASKVKVFSKLVDHDDVVQQTLMEVFTGLEKCQASCEAQFMGWVSQAARSNAITAKRDSMAVKRGKQYKHVPCEYAGADGYSATYSDPKSHQPERIVIAKELIGKLFAVAAEVSANTELAIELVAGGANVAQISQAIGISEQAVGGVLKRFRAKAKDAGLSLV